MDESASISTSLSGYESDEYLPDQFLFKFNFSEDTHACKFAKVF